jgi:hypothetical protein
MHWCGSVGDVTHCTLLCSPQVDIGGPAICVRSSRSYVTEAGRAVCLSLPRRLWRRTAGASVEKTDGASKRSYAHQWGAAHARVGRDGA